MAIKYKWLASKLKEQLKTNYQTGTDKLPSENTLCKKYQVSRQTVRQALSILEQEGYIEKKQGSGSFYTGLSLDGAQNVIALLCPTEEDYIYPTLIHTIRQRFRQAGFDTRVWITDYSRETERTILTELIKNRVSGILVEGFASALPNTNLDLYRKIQFSGTPVLFMNQPYLYDSSFPSVKDQNSKGAEMLVTHLEEQGHTNIAGLFQIDQLSGQERYLGFSLAKEHISRQSDWYTTKDLIRLRANEDISFLERFVQENLSGKTAVICDQDEIAYYLAIVLKKAGYHLPQDLAIATFGNTYYCESEILSLTSLTHKKNETAFLAVSMLLEQIKGLPVISQEIPWKLVVRQSSQN